MILSVSGTQNWQPRVSVSMKTHRKLYILPKHEGSEKFYIQHFSLQSTLKIPNEGGLYQQGGTSAQQWEERKESACPKLIAWSAQECSTERWVCSVSLEYRRLFHVKMRGKWIFHICNFMVIKEELFLEMVNNITSHCKITIVMWLLWAYLWIIK